MSQQIPNINSINQITEDQLNDVISKTKKKVIEDYLSSDLLSDVSASGAIANIRESANSKTRVGPLKNLLDKARYIYWNLRWNDMQHMSEEFWEDQLMLLVGMCPSINLINQYAVKDITSNSGRAGVRFFDFVEIRKDKVRVFELKANQISIDDVRSTIEKGKLITDKGVINCKNYLEVIKNTWPNKETKLIFTSPFGISKEALELVNKTDGINYVGYRELARSIYIELLSQYPTEAEWKYESIKGDKYRLIF